jgi:hypothetical protein
MQHYKYFIILSYIYTMWFHVEDLYVLLISGQTVYWLVTWYKYIISIFFNFSIIICWLVATAYYYEDIEYYATMQELVMRIYVTASTNCSILLFFISAYISITHQLFRYFYFCFIHFLLSTSCSCLPLLLTIFRRQSEIITIACRYVRHSTNRPAS